MAKSELHSTMIPWELYETLPDAIAALSDPAADVTEQLPPIVDCPLIECEDVEGVTCVVWDGDLWEQHIGDVQLELRLLGERFHRRRVVLDFLSREDWRVGSALLSCLWALFRGIESKQGRFAMCGLVGDLLDFFGLDFRYEPIAIPLVGDPGRFRCLRHARLFQESCPECEKRLRRGRASK